MSKTKEKYNEWKALQFLKEHGEYKRYLNEKWIVFDEVGFKHFPKEIYYLKGLEGLGLYNNQITHIPKEISCLKNLKKLNLINNNITHIPKEISHLKNNLENLWIRDNPLKQKKEDIQKLLPNTKIWI